MADTRYPGKHGVAKSGLPPYPEDDNQPEEDYAIYARGAWDEQDESMRARYLVWTQNLLFLAGRHWWQKGPGQEFGPPVVPSWREMPVTNLCLAYFRTALAKATKVRPATQTIPASTDPPDVKAAELAEEVLEAKWRELNLSRMQRRAVSWTLATGNCFLYPYWNTETGKIVPMLVEYEVPEYDDQGTQIGFRTERIPADEDGEPIIDRESGGPKLDAEPAMVDEGDVGVRVYSPFQVRVNPEAETDDDVTWFIVAEVMSLREIENRWPDKADKINAEDVSTATGHERLMGAVIGGSDTQLHSPEDDRDRDLDRTLVLHYHQRPSPDYPSGRYWVGAGSDVLLEEPGPLPDGIFPLIHMQDLQVPGSFYGAATLEAVIGINREYNEVNGAIKEHHNLMAKGKWVTDRGSGVTKGSITSQPGEVITKRPGTELKQVDIKALPAAVYNERERILADFETVSGIHKVSMGRPPPGVTAGVAFLQLQEADDTDLGPFLAMQEEVIAELARALLQIIQLRYVDDRLIAVSGPDRKFAVKSFRGADLMGAVDVVPIAESSFPWSKTARQNMLMELAAQLPQMFTDPETGTFDVDKFARLLPVGGLETLAEGQDMDVNEAQREEEMFESIAEGLPAEIPQVGWWQNHEVHYRQHVRTLKSARYQEWSEQATAAFQAHVQQHDQLRAQARMLGTSSVAGQQMLQQQQAAQAQMAAAQSGNGGAPSQGPPGAPPDPALVAGNEGPPAEDISPAGGPGIPPELARMLAGTM